jgi:hypothetical protein
MFHGGLHPDDVLACDMIEFKEEEGCTILVDGNY